uniref:Uncharacterized protein MANES_03G199200 n=1 Tax=Rhizophora mucronata TaxID=61149 RepID=A0A2P2JUK3_RHIMU
MNSNYGKGFSGSLNDFNFDLGIGSGRPKSLNDQKKNQTSSGYSSYSSSTTTTTTQQKPAWQPNKPSWAHQPAPTGLNGPTSLAGDIFGKTWNSTGSGSGPGIGIVEKNPNLFGDLVNSALGQGNKGNGNVPLKYATPTSNKSLYSMGNLADSLPKTGNSAKTSANSGSNDSFGSFSSVYIKNSSNVKAAMNNKGANLGGPPMKSMTGGIASGNGDPFGSLVDFGSKQQSGSLNSANKDKKVNAGHDGFGDFHNASGTSATTFSSGGFSANNSSNFAGTNIGSNMNLDDFGMPSKGFASQEQPPVQNTSGDPLDMFSSFLSGGATIASGGKGGQQFSEVDDWGLGSDFGGSGNDGGGATTELEGLPPPPAGITASAAKDKGMDHQRQGQYADAIKWLSWAIILLEKTGDEGSTMEVLSCRASCYKEVGEYKKAVADCSKVLEHDKANVSVLVQRALLYESMEKYKLGAEDLRNVLKVDPVNRIARSTIHRLTQMAS